MKKIIYLLLLPILLTACKSNKKQTPVDSIPAIAVDNSKGLTVEFKPIIQGVWVKTDYADDIIKTFSPYASRKKLDGIASMIINTTSALGDSVIVGVSLNNHEGYSFPLFFKAGSKINSLKTGLPDFDEKNNYYELGYRIKGIDTNLLLYHYKKPGHFLDSTMYTKVLNQPPPNDDAGYGIQYLVNEKLMAGKYTIIDTAGTTFNIELTKDGKVRGFLPFTQYAANTDFEAGPQNDLDQLYLNTNEKDQKQYLFKLKADTLDLFDVAASPDSVHLKWGKLKYKLLRLK